MMRKNTFRWASALSLVDKKANTVLAIERCHVRPRFDAAHPGITEKSPVQDTRVRVVTKTHHLHSKTPKYGQTMSNKHHVLL